MNGGSLGKNYGWEISGFRKIREFSDGMTFFGLTVNWDRYLDDHSPRCGIVLTLFNFVIVEFNVYYLWHR